MCMSPHEMSTAQLETVIERIHEHLDDPSASNRDMWIWRLDALEAVLKERAEKGTIWR